MSNFTTEVRFICEVNAGYSESKGYESVDTILSKCVDKIFNFKFPIFDEEYRVPLEKKILRHYYTREIGMETVALWKLRLETRLNEIMPYYNQLYQSELIKFNPMYDVDLTTKHTKTGNGSTTDDGTSTSDEKTINNASTSDKNVANASSKSSDVNSNTQNTSGTDYDVYSDTPQGALTNVENNTYLTNARKKTNNKTTTISGKDDASITSSSESKTDTSTDSTGSKSINGTTKNKSVVTNTEDYIQTVLGKTGGSSYSSRLKEFRETFLNIDMLIISELSDLFFGLWE
jgi:hypothetical protein